MVNDGRRRARGGLRKPSTPLKKAAAKSRQQEGSQFLKTNFLRLFVTGSYSPWKSFKLEDVYNTKTYTLHTVTQIQCHQRVAPFPQFIVCACCFPRKPPTPPDQLLPSSKISLVALHPFRSLLLSLALSLSLARSLCRTNSQLTSRPTPTCQHQPTHGQLWNPITLLNLPI